MSKQLCLIVATLLLTLGLGACSHTRSDAEIASEVQNKINTDPNIATKQVSVGATNGIATLSGSVGSDSDRATAGNDAAQVAGVKTVVNNLEAAHSTETSMATSLRHEGVPGSHRAHLSPAHGSSAVTIPEGTVLSVRLADSIDSNRSKEGDVFRGTIESPVTNGERIVIPKYADVEGEVVQAKSAGHFTGRSDIALVLTRLEMGGKAYSIDTDEYTQEGAGRGKRTAEMVGGGAGAGALIGGLTGGGKGALIGAAIGAGTGTGVQAVTHGQQIHLPSETVLQFRLKTPVAVHPSSATSR